MTNTKDTAIKDTVATVGLLIGCVLFGLGSLIVIHLPIGAYAMAFWRLSISTVVFVLLTLLYRQRLPTSRPAVIFALLSGAALGIDLGLWHESIYAVGPGISTLLNSLQIFFLTLIGFIFFKEKQTPMQFISLVLAILGVALIASPEFRRNAQSGFGFITGIASGACLAISMTWVKCVQKYERVALFPLMTLVGLGGAVVLLPVMLLLNKGAILPTTLAQIGWVAVYGVVMQCMAWGVIAYAIPRLNLTLTGLFLLSEPVAALMIDYFWLAKPITAVQWSGACLTMTAIYLGSKRPTTHPLI